MNKLPSKINEFIITSKVVNLCNNLGIPIPSRSQTLGIYGEIYAYAYFQGKADFVEPIFLNETKGREDLLLNKKIKVEVKTALKNKAGKYSLILVKNKKNGENNFDILFCLLFDDINSEPTLIKIPQERIKKIKGLNTKKEYIMSLAKQEYIQQKPLNLIVCTKHGAYEKSCGCWRKN